MCRVQNGSLNSDSVGEFPLADLTAIFQGSVSQKSFSAENLFALIFFLKLWSIFHPKTTDVN
jgi:hypothetical protein